MEFANLLSGGFRRGDTLPEGQWRSEIVIQNMFLNVYADVDQFDQALSDYYKPYEPEYKGVTFEQDRVVYFQEYAKFEQMKEAVMKERVA